jgi:hypothetical protein
MLWRRGPERMSIPERKSSVGTDNVVHATTLVYCMLLRVGTVRLRASHEQYELLTFQTRN